MPNAIPLQLTKNHVMVNDRDKILNKREVEGILKELLGDQVEIFDFIPRQKVTTAVFHGPQHNIYLIIANITFMGGQEGQHPLDLKRIQYNVLWREFYTKYNKGDDEVKWLGIYSYDSLNVFASFSPETYLEKHKGKDMISKGGVKAQYSCHVFLNDLYKGLEEGVFSKIDARNNTIVTIAPDNLFNYLSSVIKSDPNQAIIDSINKVSDTIPFKRWIRADEGIPYIKSLDDLNLFSSPFNEWRQNQWGGWYIEGYYYSYYAKHQDEPVKYLKACSDQHILNEYKQYGLDVAFPEGSAPFIGDVKTMEATNGKAYLNDETHTIEALARYGKIWIVIYLFDKKEGKTDDYSMVKWRNHYIANSDGTPCLNEMSAPYTPHSVYFKEMVIVELNPVTAPLYFEVLTQGRQHDGSSRNRKYGIKKQYLNRIGTTDGFIVHRYRSK